MTAAAVAVGTGFVGGQSTEHEQLVLHTRQRLEDGRQLEVLRVPGHTDDAIALLDRDAGFLWSGDSFYEGPIWLFAPETDLASYRESVARMAALAPDLEAVFPAHNTPRADPALLVELRDKLGQVLAGKIEPVPSPDGTVEFRFRDFGLLLREDYYLVDQD